MARQRTNVQNLKSIVGAALIGVGVLILFGNLAEAAARLSHLVGVTAEDAEKLGALVTAGLAISHTLQAYIFDRQELLRNLHRILILFWPLLLVTAGSVVFGDGFTGKAKELQKKMSDVSISLFLIRRVSRA